MKTKRTLIAVLAMALALMFVLTGCKKKWISPVPDEAVLVIDKKSSGNSENTGSSVDGEKEENQDNPSDGTFKNFETLEETIAECGIDMTLPGKVDDYHPIMYSCFNKMFIEVIYQADEMSESDEDYNRLIIRKEPTDSFTDISGTKPGYQSEPVMELANTNVHLRCNEDKCFVAIWYQDGSSYSVVSHYGIDAQQMQRIVTDVIQANLNAAGK